MYVRAQYDWNVRALHESYAVYFTTIAVESIRFKSDIVVIVVVVVVTRVASTFSDVGRCLSIFRRAAAAAVHHPAPTPTAFGRFSPAVTRQQLRARSSRL